ncbi:hypothetical protein ACSBR2_017746 [Camellia fascicularis]
MEDPSTSTTLRETLALDLQDLEEDADNLGPKIARIKVYRCFLEEPHIHGRDEDIKQIMELLLRDASTEIFFDVIPIVGMGGIGKTTLAQHIYNDDRVENHFNLKAWVCVSDDFEVMRITKAILESFTHSSCNLSNLNAVQVQLSKTLAGKKFLLVLDDVWDYGRDGWNLLQSPFGAGAPGSKIIVTTRDRGVAKQMGMDKYHNLHNLSYGDCCMDELPDSIGDLKHLRYLDVSRSGITRLPDTVVTLYNLQVLFLKFCFRLQKLPLNIGRLVNLRHFDMTGVDIPSSEEMSLHIVMNGKKHMENKLHMSNREKPIFVLEIEEAREDHLILLEIKALGKNLKHNLCSKSSMHHDFIKLLSYFHEICKQDDELHVHSWRLIFGFIILV